MWHEARRSERKVHEVMDAARRRAQRRAVYLAKRRGDPHQSLQVVGSRCRTHRDDALYHAANDLQGLIPWNGKQDILIDRFDGRALLDFIREPRPLRAQQKTDEEEELEEFVSFERYRDLIKHRRRGFDDEGGLKHVYQELEAKAGAPFQLERPSTSQPSVNKGSYSQVGYSYKGDANEDNQALVSDHDDDDDDDEDDEDDEKDYSSDDSSDEQMEKIAKEFGVKRYNWLVYMDKKAKEEEKRQKEVIRGDPSIRKLSRKERRKASQLEREREREAARSAGRAFYRDPYREPRRSPTYDAYPHSRRSRSRSRTRSPSYSRRHDRGTNADNSHGKSRALKIEYITEFGGSTDMDDQKPEAYTPPESPTLPADVSNRSGNWTFNNCKDRLDNISLVQLVRWPVWVSRVLNRLLDRSSGNRILEALRVDPASALSIDQDKSNKVLKPSVSTLSTTAKLNKSAGGGPLKTQPSEKKETPQERLKRIMNKQLTKQIKKDTAAEIAKKREQERERQAKLAETRHSRRHRRRSRSRSYSRSSRSVSPPRRRRRSRSRSRSKSMSPRRYHSSSRSLSRSRSPRVRSRSRY